MSRMMYFASLGVGPDGHSFQQHKTHDVVGPQIPYTRIHVTFAVLPKDPNPSGPGETGHLKAQKVDAGGHQIAALIAAIPHNVDRPPQL